MRVSLMRLLNITKVGFLAIARNKLRSALTMLGIIIGVGSTSSIQATISSLGTNFIMIFPGAATQSGAHIFTGESKLTPDDVQAIKTEAPAVAYASAGVRSNGQVVAGELNWGTTVYGVDVDWPFIRAWNVSQGSFFTEGDVRTSAKVCIL